MSVTENVVKFADQNELAKARETLSKAVIPDVPEQIIARAFMRLQCADVPREPWHWEVCQILQTPQVSESERLKALIRRVIEWDPAFPVESGLLDELAAATS
jgi:hypothetical protein